MHLGLSANVGTLSRKRLHEQGVSDDSGGIEGTTKKSRFVSGVVYNNDLISVEAVGQPTKHNKCPELKLLWAWEPSNNE